MSLSWSPFNWLQVVQCVKYIKWHKNAKVSAHDHGKCEQM